MSYVLRTLTKKEQVDSIIRDTLDKLVVLRFGRCSDSACLLLDDILSKSEREVSNFVSIALVDIDSPEIEVYANYFDINFIPSTIFFFNAHHMKMDSGSADHTKWVGAFHRKQDFIDVVEEIYRGAMKGKLICPTTIVPFFGDQTFWGEGVHVRGGVGPGPIQIDEFSLPKLVDAINFMLEPKVKDSANQLAKAMEDEDGVAGAVKPCKKSKPEPEPETESKPT